MPSVAYMNEHWTLEDLVDAHIVLDLYDLLESKANSSTVLP